SRWEEAERDFARALDLYPAALHLPFLAATYIQNGNFEAYCDLRQRGLDRFGRVTGPITAQSVAMTSLVLPLADPLLKVAAGLADNGLKGTNALRAPALLTKGLAEYRQDHFADALQWSEKAMALADTNDAWLNVQTYAVHTMAQSQLQQTNEAQASLDKALEL